MTWKLLTIAITLLMVMKAMTIKVISEKAEYTKIGDKMVIMCNTDEQPEFCSFIRPDRSEICQHRSLYRNKIDKSCSFENLAKIEVGVNACLISLPHLTISHLGIWRCKAFSWGEWADGRVTLLNNNNNNKNNKNNKSNKSNKNKNSKNNYSYIEEEEDWGEGKLLLREEKRAQEQRQKHIINKYESGSIKLEAIKDMRKERNEVQNVAKVKREMEDLMPDKGVEDRTMDIGMKDNLMEEKITVDERVKERILLQQRSEAVVELVDIWGVANLEAGQLQSFTCELQSNKNLGNLRWFLVKGEEMEERGSPAMEVENSDPDIYSSSILFTPEIKHDGYSLTCMSMEAKQEDHFKMKIFMLTSNEASRRSFSIQEGEDLEIPLVFSSFPATEANNVEWIIKTLNTSVILHSGQTSEDLKYMASNIMVDAHSNNNNNINIDAQNDADNNKSSNNKNSNNSTVYKLRLKIKNVSMDEGEKDHSVKIKMFHKELIISFKIEILKNIDVLGTTDDVEIATKSKDLVNDDENLNIEKNENILLKFETNTIKDIINVETSREITKAEPGFDFNNGEDEDIAQIQTVRMIEITTTISGLLTYGQFWDGNKGNENSETIDEVDNMKDTTNAKDTVIGAMKHDYLSVNTENIDNINSIKLIERTKTTYPVTSDKIMNEHDNNENSLPIVTERSFKMLSKNVTLSESPSVKTANISIIIIIGIIILIILILVVYCFFKFSYKKKKRDFDPEGRPTFKPNRFTLVIEEAENNGINDVTDENNREEAKSLMKYSGLDNHGSIIPNFTQPVKSSL